MSKTKQVRWNGGPEDPDTITHHGITFNKGEWTSVPDDSDKVLDGKNKKPTIRRLRDNSQFEVKGMEAEDHSSESSSAVANGGVARASVVTYKPVAVSNGRGKPKTWTIEGKNAITGANVPGPKDEYADEASAQVVCDGLNQVAA